MKTKHILPLLFLVTSTTAFAQKQESEDAPESSSSEEVNGYVITAKGDTLFGKVSIWKNEPWWNQKKSKSKNH